MRALRPVGHARELMGRAYDIELERLCQCLDRFADVMQFGSRFSVSNLFGPARKSIVKILLPAASPTLNILWIKLLTSYNDGK